jgi:DNA-binding transcriptional LysR family regulator
MDTLTSIKVFRHVVESGSFVGAAARLDLSAAMVSKHVMHIERRLGARLLNRNSRTLSLTEPGSMYYERCKRILDHLEATEVEVQFFSCSPRGTLRIICPSWFGGRLLAIALIEFRRRYPEIVVDVSFDDGDVNIVEEGYDLAFLVPLDIRSLPGDLIARPIHPITLCVAASREYLQRHGTPKQPGDLATHDCVASGSMGSWILLGGDDAVTVPARIVARYRSIAGVASAVAAGLGLAPLPVMFFEDPLFKDVLVPVMPEFPVQQATMYAVYVSGKVVPPKIRAFIDFALEWSRKSTELSWPTRSGVRPKQGDAISRASE